MTRVSGVVEIIWTVELPEGREHQGQMCEDPAVEAAVEGIPQDLYIYLWGQEAPAARVHYEVHEEDVVVEEDERDE